MVRSVAAASDRAGSAEMDRGSDQGSRRPVHERRSGVRIPSAPPNPQVRAVPVILNRETAVATPQFTPHKSARSAAFLGPSRPLSAGPGRPGAPVVMDAQTHPRHRRQASTRARSRGSCPSPSSAPSCGVSAQTIYDLRSQGRGPRGFRVGRELRFRVSEVEAWLERMETEDAERHQLRGRVMDRRPRTPIGTYGAVTTPVARRSRDRRDPGP